MFGLTEKPAITVQHGFPVLQLPLIKVEIKLYLSVSALKLLLF